MVSTQLKNISQNWNLPQVEVKIKKYLQPPPSIYIYTYTYTYVFHSLQLPLLWTCTRCPTSSSRWGLEGNTPKSLPLGCPGKEVIGTKVIGSVGDFTPRIYLPFIRIGEITHWSVHHWSDHFLGHPSTRTCLGEWSNLRMMINDVFFFSIRWFNQQLVIPYQFDLCDLFGMVEMLSDPFKGESWPPIT